MIKIPSVRDSAASSTLSRFIPGVVALALNSSAYVAEIIRAGILAVDRRADRGGALARSQLSGRAMKLVVLPQAIKNVLPALANEVVTMVKESVHLLDAGHGGASCTPRKTVSGDVLYHAGTLCVSPRSSISVINYPASKAIEAIERRMRRGDKQ